MMNAKVLLLMVVVLVAFPVVGQAVDSEWRWSRVERGYSGLIQMGGTATLKKHSGSVLVYSLKDASGKVDAFDLHVAQVGARRITANFVPPNTENIKISLSGVKHIVQTGQGEYLAMTMSDVESGNFLVLQKSPQKKQ